MAGILGPTLPAILDVILQVLGQVLRPTGKVTGKQFPRRDVILNCFGRYVEYLRKGTGRIERLEALAFEVENRLQVGVLGFYVAHSKAPSRCNSLN